MRKVKILFMLTLLLLIFDISASGATISIQHKVVGKYLHQESGGLKIEGSKDGIGSLGIYEQIDLGGGQTAFKLVSNGQFLRVANDGYVYADGGVGSTTSSDREIFYPEWTTLQGTGWAYRNKWNNKYLSCENTTNFPLKTVSTTINTWEVFWPETCYDMWQAFIAFSQNFPDKVKLARHNQAIVLGKDDFLNNEPWWYILYPDYRFDPWGHGAWDHMGVSMIGDWEYVMLWETQEQFQVSPLWQYGIPRIKRYWHCHTKAQDPNPYPTDSNVVNWHWLEMDCSLTYTGTASEWYTTYPTFLYDLSDSNPPPLSQENMGIRWVVEIGYKDFNERWYLDLGPAEHVFLPRYGIVRYDNGTGGVYADFNNIQNDQLVFDRRCP